MKRVALNMLHQNTGTYEIPPLEIVDEPSRSKSDGKPTPEEEERAKQKIYSIIDSVYSETARRMHIPANSWRLLFQILSPNQA
ncbi:unnamed protein product [Cylicostephanus goldi]|uniref:Uncharacterized protein n=1 Tax=Cylicostephanus goldi TaxID=71465 RepID=A0A3P7MUS3_CYLGO|nr:unnamed protein product [Cylicostephanus goldi]